MRLVITLEQRFDRTPDGVIWTSTDFSHDFWKRYLHAFDSVRVAARVRDIATAPPGYRQANGECVEFVPIPYYHGPAQFLRLYSRVRRAVQSCIGPDDAIILRISSILAGCMEPVLIRTGHPYAVEVVGDPYDVFAPGAIHHPLRPLLRPYFTRLQKRQCARACGALYVTQSALQKRYPCPAYEVGVSDVEIGEVATARCITNGDRRHRLITVGTLEQLYKSPDVLLQAMALCVQKGLDISLTFVGDGRYRTNLQTLSRDLGLTDRVTFLGALPSGSAVRSELDKADLFVLPSRQEGLPRAMVEAMARGLPCIGSTVGGIPELLPPDDLVPPGDSRALAASICAVISNPGRMAEMSARNRKTAEQYSRTALQERRTTFYRHVRDVTEAWRNSQVTR